MHTPKHPTNISNTHTQTHPTGLWDELRIKSSNAHEEEQFHGSLSFTNLTKGSSHSRVNASNEIVFLKKEWCPRAIRMLKQMTDTKQGERDFLKAY